MTRSNVNQCKLAHVHEAVRAAVNFSGYLKGEGLPGHSARRNLHRFHFLISLAHP